MAHPDDEVLWASSILGSTDAIIFCFESNPQHPKISEGRKRSLANYPLRGAACLSGLNFLALDIGVSENGPVCIEVNAEGSARGQFFMQYGFGNLL